MPSTNQPIVILQQTPAWVAIDKPPGVSVHNQEATGDLLSRLESQLGVSKLFPAHRLDKETSGIQILALTSESAARWAEAFAGSNYEKVYVAILRGRLCPPEGVWTWPLTDKSEGRRSIQGVSHQRKPCKTAYRVLEITKYFTLAELQIFTGRQHQIRKHTALAGHAIVGDPRYGDRKWNGKIQSLYQSDRLFLHAHRLVVSGLCDLTSPVPEPFGSVLASSRQ